MQSLLEIYQFTICGALRDLLPFVQFQKREKHPWRNVLVYQNSGFELHINFFLKK